ncbi:hypothetical protein I312_103666 [Cryptococcus bacillisporus CA1280]|uniref:uncharacterized protein n=1 Tax=Cryptococcus bacillisporus CA1280 TaxID=1296109 RepID=UPI0033688C8E
MKLPFQKPRLLTPFTPHSHRFSARKPHRIYCIGFQDMNLVCHPSWRDGFVHWEIKLPHYSFPVALYFYKE